jgi:opacity protein-like surface antigen
MGPSFRLRKNPGSADPSPYGITAGLGAEFRTGRFRFTPTIRYTRWSADPPYPTTSTNADQVELLTGISYDTSPEEWNVFGRRLRFGPVAGVVLTNGLEPNLRPGTPLSESQGYVAGLMTEFEVSRRFSVEADGLYRPLRAHFGDRSVPFSVVTWQFPLLAKYRVSAGPKFQPFVEAGPSFRLSGNFNGYDPSEIGITAGAGIELPLLRSVRIAPAVRYTRWRTDFKSALFHTLTNQVELLVGFSF